MVYGYEKFKHAITPSRLEMIEKRKYTIAINLFKKICEDFFVDDFSLEDITRNYNLSARGGQQYGKSHLDYLVKIGLLVYNSENKTYMVNHASVKVDQVLNAEIEDNKENDE